MSSSINPQTIRILTKVFCTSGLNLVVLASTGDEFTLGQAQNGLNFDYEGELDLEGKDQSPPPKKKNNKKKNKKTIGISTNVFYTCLSNLVILAWTGLELSRGQASAWHSAKQTQRHRQQRYPKAKTGLG